MNTFNRIVIVLDLVLFIALCIAVVVLGVVNPSAPAVAAGWLTDLADYLNTMSVWGRGISGGLIVLALSIPPVVLLVLELRRRKRKFIQVEKVAGGRVQVSVASIADRLQYEVNGLPNVLRAKATVAGKRKGVTVDVEADIAAGLDVPAKAEEIVETARRVVEEGMGLRLSRSPSVNLRAVPYPKIGKLAPVAEETGPLSSEPQVISSALLEEQPAAFPEAGSG